MAWFEDYANQSQVWQYRAAITIDALGGGGTVDATIVLPPDWDIFWDNVQTNGEDIRVTSSDGFTAATWDLNGFVKASRAGTLEIDNYAAPAAQMFVLWIYWGNSAALTGITAFVPASAKTGYVEVGGPVAPIVVTAQERPGEVRPRRQITKTSAETIFVTFDFEAELHKPRAPQAGKRRLEEIDYATTVVNLAGVDQTGMYTAANLRVFHPGYVVMEVKAGTDGSDYTIQCRIITKEKSGRTRTLARRAWLKVRDTDEA